MIIKSSKIVLEHGIENNIEIVIENNKISKIMKSNAVDVFKNINQINENTKYDFISYKKLVSNNTIRYNNLNIDFEDCYICPGFVDTHIHGFAGSDIMDKKIESIENISKNLLNTGVTSYLATTLTSSKEDIDEVIRLIRLHQENATNSSNKSKIQGIFLEGPFFTEKYRGAQNSNYFLEPNSKLLEHWYKLSGGLVKKVALSPEFNNASEFIKSAKKLGISVALGHSDADFTQAKKSVESGANIFIHTYNAMSPLHHREPGMVGASLTLNKTYSEIICDGHHVHPVAIDVLLRCKTPEKVVLISDCMMAGGMPDGKYKLGEFDVNVKDGAAKLKEGNLAGSVLKLSNSVKNIINWGIVNPYYAIQMATLIPAKSVNIDNICGKIETGRYADFTVLDSNFDVVSVIVNGNLNMV